MALNCSMNWILSIQRGILSKLVSRTTPHDGSVARVAPGCSVAPHGTCTRPASIHYTQAHLTTRTPTRGTPAAGDGDSAEAQLRTTELAPS